MRVARLLAAAAAAALLAVPAASARGSGELVVFAAASLTDALPELAPGNAYAFAGSDELATQIEHGAPADVFLSADTKLPARLHREGLLRRPVVFARNALVVVVPRSNPARIHGVRDLARPGVAVDVASASVPVGRYTQRALRRLRLSAKVNANVVSHETDVRAVLGKVVLGQADAGVVYSTDARAVHGEVRVIRIPGRAQPDVAYALGVVAGSPHEAAARAFVARVLGKRGQAVLGRYGFLPPRAA
ncbi:MAG TPA: molybdate ABC transporter substrate-binding protein [Gaiellaceae bacterium]|nr:molybdate ABC transporter substrate-binding protein [Gaiellaceae bacterium]